MDWLVYGVALPVGLWLVWLSRRRPKRKSGLGFLVISGPPNPPPSNALKTILTLLGFGLLAWWTYYVLVARSLG